MKNIIFMWIFLPLSLLAQEKEKEKQEPVKIKLAEKQILRSGNDLFKQKRFVDAEVKYKKALKENPNYSTAGYNLGNAVYEQNRLEEALPLYELVAKSAGETETREKSFHNIGNVMMKQKQYDKAIEAYKNSLLLNPNDETTRYNLALAQKLLKDQQQNDQNKDQNKDKDKDQNKDQDQDENKDQNSENKDQNEDEGGDDKKDQDKNEGDNKNDENDQQDQKNEGDKKEQNKQPQPNQLSQQQIEQLLEAMNNEENKTQQKVNANKAKGKKVNQEKDW
ncbi:tetratricopeptide repeat protein [Lutimonas sp.]|uniref:tetratricopeptide repeat protein n=1 Tax=Lutimonas sp. TaxID=1872403 RepID=UPI003C72E94E